MFDYILQSSDQEYSPFSNSLADSTFDGIAPYELYPLKNIISDIEPSQRSEKGFDLLKTIIP